MGKRGALPAARTLARTIAGAAITDEDKDFRNVRRGSWVIGNFSTNCQF
jgi:hypothetical protein